MTVAGQLHGAGDLLRRQPGVIVSSERWSAGVHTVQPSGATSDPVWNVTGQAEGPLFSMDPYRDDREDSNYGTSDDYRRRQCKDHDH